MRYLLSGMAIFAVLSVNAAGAAPKKVGPPVEIKSKVIDELSSEYFGYFDLEIQNNTDKWLVLKDVEIVFPDSVQSRHIRVIKGADFDRWQRVMQKRIAKDELDKNASLAVIGALGYGLTALSGNRGLQNVGALAAAGAGGAYAASEYSKIKDSIVATKRYPENHLLGDSIVVLPGLSEGRWLLLNSSNHDSTKLVSDFEIRFTLNGGERQSCKIKVGQTAWQKSLWWSSSFEDKRPGMYGTP